MENGFDLNSLAGKRVLVLGLAREGESLARYLATQQSKVVVTDSLPAARLQDRITRLESANVEFLLGAADPAFLSGIDLVFVTPGAPETNPVIVEARRRGVPVTNATQLFLARCPATVIGVTGTSGKTTTASLVTTILRAGGRRVLLGGNIGLPMIDLLDDANPETLVVIELSSFQLALVSRSPNVAVVTNISPNHLDRHGSMECYIGAKRHIVHFQTPSDVAVLNTDDPTVVAFRKATAAKVVAFSRTALVEQGAHLHGDMVAVRVDDTELAVMSRRDIPLPGDHNLENVLAAVATASVLDVGPDAMRDGICSFTPVSHRLEPVAVRHGPGGGSITFVNDSIATSPERCAVGIRALGANIVLIAGGRSKNLPWDAALGAMDGRVTGLVLLGEAADEIEQAVRDHAWSAPFPVRRVSSMEEAVAVAADLASRGATVLLAPGCTSYDMYVDFEERGNSFRRAVEGLCGYGS